MEAGQDEVLSRQQRGRLLRGSHGAVLALILLGFGLRILRLEFQPLWWDEGYSVWFATHPLGQMAALTAQDIHPPLYYALLHGWSQIFGTSPLVLRLMSVISGTLTIPAIYLVGRRLLGARPALLAAFLVAISPMAIFYSQEVRMYGLVALLGAGILLAEWWVLAPSRADGPGRAPVKDGGRELVLGLLPYVLLATAALYTQYYALFLPIGLTLFALWQWRRGKIGKKRALYWLSAQGVIALLYLPWVIYAGPRLVPYVSQKVVQDADRPLGLLAYLGRHLSAFSAGHLEGPLAPFWPAALVLLIPAVVGLIWSLQPAGMRADPPPSNTHDAGKPAAGFQTSAGSRQRSAIFMMVLVLLSALLLGWLIGLRYPFFPERGERLLLLVLPAFLLLLAAGLEAFIRRLPVVGYAVLGSSVAVSLGALAAFYLVPRYPDDDYRPLIAHIVEQGLPGDTVFADYPWQAGYWRAYGDPNGPTDMLTPELAWGTPVAAELQDALDRGRVWFPEHLSLGGVLESRVEDYLRAHAVPFVNEWHGPNTRLSAWAAVTPGSPVSLEPARFSLAAPGAGMIQLSSASWPSDPVPASNAVMPLSLEWIAGSQPPELAASVRLTDDLAQIWAQHDYEPVGGSAWRAAGAAPCDACGDKSELRGQQAHPWKAVDRLGLLVPVGTPPGRYHLEVVLHAKGEASALSVVDAEGQVLGDHARLFDVTVDPADRELALEHLPISVHSPVDMGSGIRLLGYSMDESPATPGDLRKISLFWQATGQPLAELTAFVQLLDQKGRVAAGWEAPPGASYPTQVWGAGELIRTQAEIRVPASLPDGSYSLIGGLFRSDDKTRLQTSRGDDHFHLGRVTVKGRAHEMSPPSPARRSDVQFDNLARLVGYDFASPSGGLRAGDTVPLTLHWQALGASERPYTVFVHLLNESGASMGFGDSEPAGGRLPTTGWLAGEYISDPHQVAVLAEAPSGAYRVAVGLYDPATGERLKTPDGADHVLLDPVVHVR